MFATVLFANLFFVFGISPGTVHQPIVQLAVQRRSQLRSSTSAKVGDVVSVGKDYPEPVDVPTIPPSLLVGQDSELERE